MQNLDNLCNPGALLQTDCIVSQTVKDAIGLVPLLGERYLWVDALCITQDDERTREYLVKNMAAVYANATLTIVAADSIDANSGLRGLKGISKPRNNLCVFDLPDGTRLNRPSEGGLGDTEWNMRGWTFQENEDFVLYDRDTWYYPMDYMKRVIPLVRWSTRQNTKSMSLDIAYQNEWYVWKMRYSRPDALDEALLPVFVGA
ncbi:hypothetical protein SLS56_000992 [Neofusicoccum ribis]|uniref:Heterokaryon incompatibility domain-containing protein n=1 Tax=Neofusicoccum ribis TaxID=45134 RepID=A0ABR3TBK1_9PEZI